MVAIDGQAEIGDTSIGASLSARAPAGLGVQPGLCIFSAPLRYVNADSKGNFATKPDGERFPPSAADFNIFPRFLMPADTR